MWPGIGFQNDLSPTFELVSLLNLSIYFVT
jgi:hypothetical protein